MAVRIIKLLLLLLLLFYLQLTEKKRCYSRTSDKIATTYTN